MTAKKKSINWTMIVLLAILVVCVFNTFHGSGPATDTSWKDSLKSFRQRDKVEENKYDSMKVSTDILLDTLSAIKESILQDVNKIQTIKTQANEKRNTTRALPADQQLLLFSGWLSTVDTIR